MSRRLRVAIAAAAIALALPVTAYVLPSAAILRLAAKRRADAAAQSGELRGTFSTGATAPTAAVLWVKGGRCGDGDAESPAHRVTSRSHGRS